MRFWVASAAALSPVRSWALATDWMTVSMESRLKPFSDASTSREQIDALVWFGFAGVDDVLFRVNGLEFPGQH